MDKKVATQNGIFDWTWKHPVSSLTSTTHHEESVERFVERGTTCLSIVISRERLDEDLYDDPKYNRRTTEILCSIMEENARKVLSSHNYFSDDRIKELADKYDIETSGANHEVKEPWKHWSKLKDAFFDAQVKVLYTEIIDKFKRQFEEDEEAEGTWEEVNLRILLPRTIVRSERVYNIPRPFNFWDERDGWAQFYLAKSPHKNQILYSKGSSCGSSSRYNHGYWAHVFASYTERGNVIPTLRLFYNRRNELELGSTYDGFKAVDMDLSGNYPSTKEVMTRLFSGRRLSWEEIVAVGTMLY